MNEFLTSYTVSDFLTSMVAGDLNLATGFAWVVVAAVLSMIGGAIGGMLLAGKEIGYSFSAMLGALFAPAGGVTAIVLGLFVLNLLANI